MTVNTTTNKIVYAANGSTTQWTFPFPGVSATDIQVFITDVNGFITQLNPIAYTVTLNPPVDPNPTSVGGMVVYPLVGSPLATGNSLTIIRVLPQVQTTALSNQGILYPEVIEGALDYSVMLDQGFGELLGRSIVVPVSDPNPAPLPPAAQRANQAAFFDSSGNLTSGLAPGGTAFVSAAMQPVVAAATISIAQNLLGTQALINAAVSAAVLSLFTTGDLKPTHKTVPDAGWILLNDGAIGDALSGAGNRANADTAALFALYYNNYSDTLCPLATSAGAPTTRAAQGTSSAAFAAHCRMGLPLALGRALAVAGLGSGLTNRVLGSTIGTETITPSIATMVNHAHNYNDCTQGPGPQVLLGGTTPLGASVPTSPTGGNTPFNNMQPATFVNVLVKL
jgi:hypothetical protein